MNAKVFWSGKSQAVRLPKEFRVDAAEMAIRKVGRTLLLEPVARDWRDVDRYIAALSSDFLSQAREQPPMQEREGL
jgi:antitoxin VapB